MKKSAFKHTRNSDGYYHFEDDLRAFPGAWCYVVWSRRGPGKTYSSLKWAYEQHIPIIYMKRTINDVNLICSNMEGFDPSPYSPINRDIGTNIKAVRIKDGIGAFYECDEEGNPAGVPVSYILALNAVKKFKGFDFSHCKWIILDEFIPQMGEVVKHAEGEQLLDLYMTVARDRQKRGQVPLRLVLFANAENITTPVTTELEIVDDMVNLAASGETHSYNESRGIMLHHITEKEIPIKDSERSGIYKAMEGTAWGAKAFGGEFSNNDFTNIQRLPIKNMSPLLKLYFKSQTFYIYCRNTDGMFYMTTSAAACPQEFDLRKENDQKKFFLDWVIDLRLSCIDGNMKFSQYSMYDLIMNYKNYFEV